MSQQQDDDDDTIIIGSDDVVVVVVLSYYHYDYFLVTISFLSETVESRYSISFIPTTNKLALQCSSCLSAAETQEGGPLRMKRFHIF